MPVTPTPYLHVSLCGQVLCVQARWPGKVAYSGLFVWLCKCLRLRERMNTEVPRAPGGHRAPPLAGHRDVILCTYELTCYPVTFDPTRTSTQQKLNPNLTCWIVLVRLPQATNNLHIIMTEPSEGCRKNAAFKTGKKEKGKPELNTGIYFTLFST